MKKFPFTKQLDAMDCGPACLNMVTRFYGKHYSIQKLREMSFITRAGVSMLGICRGGCIYSGLDKNNKLNESACVYQKKIFRIFLRNNN